MTPPEPVGSGDFLFKTADQGSDFPHFSPKRISMKKSLLALIITATFLTTACEDKETLQKLQNAEKTRVQLEMDLKNVKAENETLKAELTKAQQNVQLQVEIVKIFDKSELVKHKVNPREEYAIEETKVGAFVTMPKTNLDWLNNILVKKAYAPLGWVLRNPSEQGLIKLIEENYHNMIASAKEEPVIGYDENMYSEFIGQRNHIATFSMENYSYGGGAHGMHYLSYINVDLNKKVEIRLNDLISSENQSKLKKVLWKNYSNERLNEKGEYNGFANPKEFRISEEFYFNNLGIVFVYPPYELGPYSEGYVEILTYWEDINDLINTDYQRTEKDGFFKE